MFGTCPSHIATDSARWLAIARYESRHAVSPVDVELCMTSNFVVYGLRYVPKNKIVYVGSTCRGDGDVRHAEHLNLSSGARRVVLTFAQERFNPLEDNFCMEELWSGACSKKEALAIEQYMMNKHETRVRPRPTNGVTVDIDIIRGEYSAQLNISRSCKDESMIQEAAARVNRDMAITVSRPNSEKLRMKNTLQEILASVMDIAEQSTASTIHKAMHDVSLLHADQLMNVTQIHQYLNSILTAWTKDDGKELRDQLNAKLRWYNVDRRGSDYTCRSAVVYADLVTLAVAMGISTSCVVPKIHISEPAGVVPAPHCVVATINTSKPADISSTGHTGSTTSRDKRKANYQEWVPSHVERRKPRRVGAKTKVDADGMREYSIFKCIHGCGEEVPVPTAIMSQKKTQAIHDHLCRCPALSASARPEKKCRVGNPRAGNNTSWSS